jgi:short subunit dehydrogenase-like uncharacterized protein
VSAWLLYGAYGYTGRLLAREALERGHRPILAGRRSEALVGLREGLEEEGVEGAEGLELRSFPLSDPGALRRGLEGVGLVLHAAGPFIETGVPMMEACLEAGAHYLDITGEVPVFEAAFERGTRARARGVVLMPGVGLDVVPTDAVASRLAQALPGAVRLELALQSPGRPSAGTLRTVVEGIPRGLLVRREGVLRGAWPGARGFRRQVDFGPVAGDGSPAGRIGGTRRVSPYPWGDLSTAFRTTGIPDITCYMATSLLQARALPILLPVLRGVLAVPMLRRFVRGWVGRGPDGPSAEQRATGRVRVWGRVEDAAGGSAEQVIEIPEGYRFTALAGVRAVEAVLGSANGRRGRTPAGLLGAEWFFALPGVAPVRGGTVRLAGERDKSAF